MSIQDQIKALQDQVKALEETKQKEERQKEYDLRNLAVTRMKEIDQFAQDVLALCMKYEARCKDSAPMLRLKAGKAVEIAAGRSKDFSGT